jgi:hypothetical protein
VTRTKQIVLFLGMVAFGVLALGLLVGALLSGNLLIAAIALAAVIRDCFVFRDMGRGLRDASRTEVSPVDTWLSGPQPSPIPPGDDDASTEQGCRALTAVVPA